MNIGSPQWRLPVCSPALGAGWEAGCILSSSRKHPKLGFLTHTFIDKGQYHHHLDHNHQDELDEQRSQRGRRASWDVGKHQVRHRLPGGRHELLLHRCCKPGWLKHKWFCGKVLDLPHPTYVLPRSRWWRSSTWLRLILPSLCRTAWASSTPWMIRSYFQIFPLVTHILSFTRCCPTTPSPVCATLAAPRPPSPRSRDATRATAWASPPCPGTTQTTSPTCPCPGTTPFPTYPSFISTKPCPPYPCPYPIPLF